MREEELLKMSPDEARAALSESTETQRRSAAFTYEAKHGVQLFSEPASPKKIPDAEFVGLSPALAESYLQTQVDAKEKARLQRVYLWSNQIHLGGGDPASTPGDNVGVAMPNSVGAWAWIMIVIGVVLAGGSYFFDVSVASGAGGDYGIPDRIANIDKIAVRHMILVSGFGLLICGHILLASERISTTLSRPQSGMGR